jgi:hypothetical protein
MTGKIGISHNGIECCVQHLPNRKKPMLTVQIDNTIYGVASFVNEDMADWFLTQMMTLFGQMRGDGDE